MRIMKLIISIIRIIKITQQLVLLILTMYGEYEITWRLIT